ncbi:type III-A CRISPR-associated RAMP protein Csm5 [Peptacetobacter sp.]|uniref:type III-A CRISPR-associated RAMP protein Csm5 n=1 Tax=Peptacetobacter sp. TaxID=2991975 RepID=UPI0026019412|nr:type III-A CRISPR-associated RAMP protein Csm5 [Peptacetobacter sp.]
MQDYLKKYEVTIRTKGPIYIGSGKNIGKKEYYFDENNNKVYLFNFEKMFKGIINKNLDKKYQEYMFNAKAKMDLGEFFKKNGIGIMDIKNWSEYSIDASNIYNLKEFKFKGINTFIKESGNKNYIPGSSLKGAIRTALIVDGIVNNYKDFIKIGDKILSESKNSKKVGININEIENRILRTIGRKNTDKKDAVNDIMSCIKVSDSQIIPNEYMTLCQRMDMDVDGNITQLPIYYECIKPGVDIKTTITIDTSITDDINIEKIKKSIKTYSERIDSDFISYFNDTEQCNINTLFLGGYSGFPSKTIVYPLLQSDGLGFIEQILHNSFRKHNHLKDGERYNVSPRKIKVAEYGSTSRSGIYEMGKIEIDFKKI